MRVLVGLVVLADFVRFEIVGIPRSLMDSIGLRGFVCFYVFFNNVLSGAVSLLREREKEAIGIIAGADAIS